MSLLVLNPRCWSPQWCVKSLRWIHITLQGVCTPEGDCPWCVHIGELKLSKYSLCLLTVGLVAGRVCPGAKMHDINNNRAEGGKKLTCF